MVVVIFPLITISANPRRRWSLRRRYIIASDAKVTVCIDNRIWSYGRVLCFVNTPPTNVLAFIELFSDIFVD